MITGIKIKEQNQLSDRFDRSPADSPPRSEAIGALLFNGTRGCRLLSTVTPALTDVKRARFRQPDDPVPTCARGSPPGATRRRYSNLLQDVTTRRTRSLRSSALCVSSFFPPCPLFPRSSARRGRCGPGCRGVQKVCGTRTRSYVPTGFPKLAGRDEARRGDSQRCLLPYPEAPSTPVPESSFILGDGLVLS